jgi:hypothetical protein
MSEQVDQRSTRSCIEDPLQDELEELQSEVEELESKIENLNLEKENLNLKLQIFQLTRIKEQCKIKFLIRNATIPFECSICQEKIINDYCFLPCVHMFHIECIQKLEKCKCPNCREDFIFYD